MAGPDAPAFPPEMADFEATLIARRRAAAGGTDDGSRVGVALSGGGIRSATFALGVFQALAKLKLLARIDYISTVSGGGYFGAFLGRLFTRDYIRGVQDVEWILGAQKPPDRNASPDLVDAERQVFRWLRENGRYLAPQGSGDLLLAGAALLRNWVAIQAVIATALLSLFLLLQLPRVLAPHVQPATVATVEAQNMAFVRSLPFSQFVWWSPWTPLPLLILGVAFAIGWSYWIVTDRPRLARGLFSVVAIVVEVWLLRAFGSPGEAVSGLWHVVILAILIAATCRYPADGAPAAIGVSLLALHTPGIGVIERSIAWVLLVVASMAIAIGTATWLSTTRQQPSGDEDPGQFRSQLSRNILTRYLRGWLVAAGTVAVIVTIDSIGQTMYAATVAGHLKAWFAAIAIVLGIVAGYGRKLVVIFGGQAEDRRPPLTLAVASTAVALAIVVVFAIGFDLLSHAVAWRFCAAAAPETIVDPYDARSTLPTCPQTPERQAPHVYLLWLAGAAVLTFAFGRYFDFLNYSSHQTLLSARLIRAYLGASNAARWRRGSWVPVIEPIADDDIEVHQYWATPTAPQAGDGYDRAAPLHLVNVTINETFSGESQVEQRDRKGIGMALGPAGVSAGVRHHVVYGPDTPTCDTSQRPALFRRLTADERHRAHIRRVAAIYPKHTERGPAFRMFEYPRARTAMPRASGAAAAEAEVPDEFPGEPLSLGLWVGISGASYSTGLGFRTSLGLSLLAGLANVRLGYWWDSGVPTRRRPLKMTVSPTVADRLSRVLVGLFPVHTYLFYELTAHFPGSSRRHWYLSDGGHFENMGGYELIRRRLPLIIVLDAESDEDYSFDGMANLTRKARLDFGVEIEFLDHVEDTLPSAFGPLEALRPVSTTQLDPRRSASHAAVARVKYPDPDGFEGRLVYIKPGITGDEPVDVREYARQHLTFPQETTADQFFDEAQWESYRKLGEHIGLKVFEHTGNNWWLERWKYKPY